jgi:uncharacterized protein (TIGR03067 family)
MSPLLLGLALTVGAPALKEKPVPEPTLVGEWAPESVTVGGHRSEPGLDRWVFAADGTWAIHGGGKAIDAGAFTWDPKRSPGTMDLASAVAGRPANLCRYRLDGDVLVLSVGHDPDVRPADVQPATKTTVWVFKRVVKKD